MPVSRRRNRNKGKKNTRKKPKAKQPERTKQHTRQIKLDIFYNLGSQIALVVLFAVFLSLGFYFLKDNPERAVWMFFFAVVSVALGLSFFVLEKLTIEPENSGILRPAKDPTPDNRCNVPPEAIGLYFGNSVAWITNTQLNPYPIVILGNETIVSLERTSDGLYLNANIRSEDGRFIAKIEKNEFRRNGNNSWYQKRNDKSTLEVRDERDQVVLYVRYLNPNSIKVLGTFYSGESYLKIEESQMTSTRNRVFSGMCIGENRGFGFRVQ